MTGRFITATTLTSAIIGTTAVKTLSMLPSANATAYALVLGNAGVSADVPAHNKRAPKQWTPGTPLPKIAPGKVREFFKELRKIDDGGAPDLVAAILESRGE